MHVDYYKKPLKFLEKLDKIDAKRVFDRLELLGGQPFPSDSKRVEGYKEKLFRIRIGDYRAIYLVDHVSDTVWIVRIDKRSKVYD